MSHYYSEKQDDIESNPSEFIYKFNDHSFKFHTDNGVFSKEYVDYGSYALLKEFKPNNIDLPILDMGSGYGPIGIIVSKLFNKEVHMCEINERAYNLSLKNIKENNANCIAYHSNLYEKLPVNLNFSSIITNPPIRAGKDVIFSIYEGAYTHLSLGGELWVVIQKKQGAPSTKAKLEEIFNNCEIIKRDKGYYILKSIKKDMK